MFTFRIRAQYATTVIRTVQAENLAKAQRKADRLARRYGANCAIFVREGA